MQGSMISDAQITILRMLSKDVAISIDRAVKAKMQEQRISQGQLLLQTTRLLCSLQSQEQVIEAACQCACQLLHADEASFVDCSSLDAQLYNPVSIVDPSTRGQLFQAFVWQKMKNDNDGAVAAESTGGDDDANDITAGSDNHADEDVDDTADDSSPSRSCAAAAFIRSIFNRAPPSPASLQDAWYFALRISCHTSLSHVTPRTGFRAPATGGGVKHAAAAAASWSKSHETISQLPRLFLSREHSLAQVRAPLFYNRNLSFHTSAGEPDHSQATSQF